jgi:hypothetical protein
MSCQRLKEHTQKLLTRSMLCHLLQAVHARWDQEQAPLLAQLPRKRRPMTHPR